jgi:hypothetical protein
MGLIFSLHAQTVPNYVPSSGLVGWFPFNGNADDESSNGNNGTVSGATLTTDRAGNPNRAYSFDGASSINVPSFNSISGSGSFSISFWTKPEDFGAMVAFGTPTKSNGFTCGNKNTGSNNFYAQVWDIDYDGGPPTGLNMNEYFHIAVVYNDNKISVYRNAGLTTEDTVDYVVTNILSGELLFGKQLGINEFFKGDLDDIALYNRALTVEEINSLYKGCILEVSIQPEINENNLGDNALFTVEAIDSTTTIRWQSNPANIGWINLANNGTYNGVNTNFLNINNVQLQNHLQPFRVIATKGDCSYISDVVKISITDTCVNTVNDTIYLSVTDTLIIKSVLSGIDPPNNISLIKAYPNPASTQLFIDFGDNYSILNGYSIKITNAIGQEIFVSGIIQQLVSLDLSLWPANGLYFLSILDDEGTVIETKKIILQ